MSIARFVWAMHAKAVELTGSRVGEVAVKDLVGAFAQPEAVRFSLLVGCIEETEVDGGSVLGKEGEVDAFSIPGRAERIWLAGPDAERGRNRESRLVSPRKLATDLQPGGHL